MADEWYLTFGKILSDGIPWLLSTVVGGLITYLYQLWYGSQKKKEELIATCHSVAFSLALQCSELVKLLKNLQYRLDLINTLGQQNPQTLDQNSRQDLKSALYDFDLNEALKININELGGVILPAGKECRGILESLQSIYICHSEYLKIVNAIKNYHEFKRSMRNEDPMFIEVSILSFANNNFQTYLKLIASAINHSERALDSFRTEIENKLGIKIYVALGDTIQLP